MQVFVAHLGRMSLTNRPGAPRDTHYSVSVRDISLASVCTRSRTPLHKHRIAYIDIYNTEY